MKRFSGRTIDLVSTDLMVLTPLYYYLKVGSQDVLYTLGSNDESGDSDHYIDPQQVVGMYYEELATCQQETSLVFPRTSCLTEDP